MWQAWYLEASRQVPECSRVRMSNGIRAEVAPPDPQQPIGVWLWTISVAGVVFYVAGVVFGGQQAGARVPQGAHV
mgnify:CR=1 FL=1